MGISVPISWLLWLLLGPRPQLLISPETTWITEPVTEDGYVDYSDHILQHYGNSPVLSGETAMGNICDLSGESLDDNDWMCNDFRCLAGMGFSSPSRAVIPSVYQMESDACKCLAMTLLHPQNSVPKLKRYVVTLPTERPIREIQAAVDTHFRYARLKELQGFHRTPRYQWKSWAGCHIFLGVRWREANTNWNEVLRLQNQLITRIRDDVCSASSFREQRDLLQRIYEDEGNNESNDGVNRSFGCVYLSGQAYHFVTSAIELSVDYRFAHMACYLAEWKATHGTYPNELKEVIPPAEHESRIEKIFTDPFSNEQFLYERRGDGFVLYSVGHNLKDDFGHAHYGTLPSEYRNKTRGDIRTGRRPDDIVFRWPLR